MQSCSYDAMNHHYSERLLVRYDMYDMHHLELPMSKTH